MRKSCVQYVHNLFETGVASGVRVCTTYVYFIVNLCKSVGQVEVLLPSTQNLSAELYHLKNDQFSLLFDSFTHFPQPLLLLSKKI